jgi:diguanylate cyclase (GGDEF)-like protein
LRYAAPLLLGIHLGIRLIFPEPTIFTDLFIYNLVAILAAFNVLAAPRFNDHWAKLSIFGALFLWATASTISTWNTFFKFNFPNYLTDISYAIFYPLICFGIFRALTFNRKVISLELFDTLIIGLGATSVITSLLLKPAMLHFDGSAYTVFFSILYPVGDVVIVGVTVALAVQQRINIRSGLLLTGVIAFAVNDLYFLWISNNHAYTFGSLTDDGWLIALIFIAESLRHSGGEAELNERVNTIATTISLLLSALILAIAALKPNYFPSFVLIPGFSTILLAFWRMTVAIRDAKHVTEERELARTDELTGLPNRRKFLAELDLLLRKEGMLLILDLNGFKKVNDEFGHDVGDELLRQVAARFSRAILANALIARLGGDEFGVIIYGPPNLGRETALALRSTLTYPFSLPVGEVSVGVSIGACMNSKEIRNKEDLLRSADAAMYEAKRGALGLVEREK